MRHYGLRNRGGSIEIKRGTLSVDDVNEHLSNLAQFRKFFPYLADKKILGAVAGIVIDEGAGKYAYRKGW